MAQKNNQAIEMHLTKLSHRHWTFLLALTYSLVENLKHGRLKGVAEGGLESPGF